jgi:tetratricopeptide (TPR) repeat protein
MQKGNVPPSRPYDKAHCERLVEDLDRFGAESFVAGEYQKALGAFNHSLQVKTQIMTDCDNSSTAITIHCIADCYSKKGKWIQAMDAYNAALLVLEKAADTKEVRTSRIALDQKVQIIRRMLGLQSISES